jgi:hypothetical protein
VRVAVAVRMTVSMARRMRVVMVVALIVPVRGMPVSTVVMRLVVMVMSRVVVCMIVIFMLHGPTDP